MAEQQADHTLARARPRAGAAAGREAKVDQRHIGPQDAG
jgi:hypothetical protein